MTVFKRILCGLLAALFLAGAAWALQPEPLSLKVACVGDSLTYGTGAANRFTDSWPSVLAAAEGPLDLTTLNFGSYGRTVTPNRFLAYTNTRTYRQSLEADADVYLVMLGSNDLLLRGWERSLPQAYRTLLQSYINLPQKPEVIVILPPDLYYKNFLRYTNVKIDDLRQMERRIAEELGLDVIDLSEVSGDMEDYCIDGGHYNSEGYAIFGSYIYEQLCPLVKKGLLSRL